MNYVLDIIIIAICALTVFLGVKRGFFKSVMTLCSGVLALLVAYTFTPRLAEILKAKVFLSSLAGSISDTLSSIAKTGTDAVYDLTKLSGNSQFQSILDQYGVDSDSVSNIISESDNTRAAVDSLSYTIADPIAQTISNITAFIILFVAALIVLRIVTVIIGAVFKLPVLKTMDKALGLVFGILSAVLFVCVFSLLAGTLIDAISAVSPGVVSRDILDNSILLQFFSKYNIVGVITDAIGV